MYRRSPAHRTGAPTPPGSCRERLCSAASITA
jgi:hypothetical protein